MIFLILKTLELLNNSNSGVLGLDKAENHKLAIYLETFTPSMNPCRLQGGIALSVVPFPFFFSAVFSSEINPEMTCNSFDRELTSTANKRNILSFHQLVCCR